MFGELGLENTAQLSGSAGTARHVQKNKYIARDSTFWHESHVSQACVGVVVLLALQKTKGARNVAARCLKESILDFTKKHSSQEARSY